MAPYLSFVVAAQNIATHGNLLERLQASMDSIRSCGLNAEYILVEWNPPAGREPLRTALRWEHAGGIPAQLITIPAALHDSLPNPYSQLFFEWRAKNIGIRAAKGQFIACMNADDILTPYSAAEMRDFKPAHFYRMNRFDLMQSCASSCRSVSESYPSNGASAPGELFMIKRANGDYAPGEPHIGRSKTGVPYSPTMLHFNASGDFLCMAREHWMFLRGYPEVPYDGSVDGQMVWIAHRHGLKQVVLESPLYHLDHPRGGRVMYTPPWSDATPFGERNRDGRWGILTG